MFFPLQSQDLPEETRPRRMAGALALINILLFFYFWLLQEGGLPHEDKMFVMSYWLYPTEVLVDSSLAFSLFSYAFVHESAVHLFGNLWFLWVFAGAVEGRLGAFSFLLLYLGAGVGAGLAHILFAPYPLIGASGAVAGIMGAFIFLFPHRRITCYVCPVWFFIRRWEVPAWIVLGIYVVLQSVGIFSGGDSSKIAFDCHLGGFVAGTILTILLDKASSRVVTQ
jgi:membrane associated rhomboid family serine protease